MDLDIVERIWMDGANILSSDRFLKEIYHGYYIHDKNGAIIAPFGPRLSGISGKGLTMMTLILAHRNIKP